MPLAKMEWLISWPSIWSFPHSESGIGVPSKFEDYLKIDFHDWMNIRILFFEIASVLFSAEANGGGLPPKRPFVGKFCSRRITCDLSY